MLKDITLGQFFPADSPIHRLDARIKIVLSIAFMFTVFFVGNIAGYISLALFVGTIILISTIPFKYILKGVKPLIFFIIFTALLNMFLTGGNVIWQLGFIKITDEGIKYAVFMSLRIIFLVIGTSMLTYTTSPIELTDGMESLLRPVSKFGIPVHEIAMMMSIALRFIPTLIEETDKIMKAQIARGIDFESGNIIKRAKALIPILVPLFISAFRRADDLAIAMECRCYHGGENRTKLREPKLTKADFLASLIFLIFITLLN